jgi:hypothetical protein
VWSFFNQLGGVGKEHRGHGKSAPTIGFCGIDKTNQHVCWSLIKDEAIGNAVKGLTKVRPFFMTQFFTQ